MSTGGTTASVLFEMEDTVRAERSARWCGSLRGMSMCGCNDRRGPTSPEMKRRAATDNHTPSDQNSLERTLHLRQARQPPGFCASFSTRATSSTGGGQETPRETAQTGCRLPASHQPAPKAHAASPTPRRARDDPHPKLWIDGPRQHACEPNGGSSIATAIRRDARPMRRCGPLASRAVSRAFSVRVD